MLVRALSVFLCLGTAFGGDPAGKSRNDIDLQTCIDNFDVHKDKIIRTQDSQEMGAKYLNEIDLGSREECLRLCCETDTCDVFVYEEKSPGSCYLFRCGPPEDFKCKFTRHANYSSAVLAVNRHLNELETQIRNTKHEQDLTSLRKPDEARTRPAPTDVVATTRRTGDVPSTKPPTGAVPGAGATPARRCSRYQFECRASAECIAIYNACDGIPQCADGSDEGPELGCPEPAPTAGPPLLGRTPPPPQPPQPPSSRRDGLPPPYVQPMQMQMQMQMQGAVRKQLPPMVQDVPGVGAAQGYDPGTVGRPYARPGARPDWTAAAAAANQQPSAAVAAVRPPQYADKNSRIFQHKESGLQVMDTPDRYKYKGAMQTLHRAMALGQYSDAGGPAGMQYGDANAHGDYSMPKMPSYYGEMYRAQYPGETWPQNQQTHGDLGSPYAGSDNWPPQLQPQPPPQYQQPVNSANDQSVQMYRQNVDSDWKADLLDKQAEAKTFDHAIIHEPKEFAEKKDSDRVAKADDGPSSKVDETHATKRKHAETVAEELKQLADLEDGEAERPGGAILSLTLGVCLTCVMAVLIGCRLRVVRRRMRRGGKSPYAHDADYLVNGMYL